MSLHTVILLWKWRHSGISGVSPFLFCDIISESFRIIFRTHVDTYLDTEIIKRSIYAGCKTLLVGSSPTAGILGGNRIDKGTWGKVLYLCGFFMSKSVKT